MTAEISLFAKRLREYGRAIEGDGFGKIGNLKAAIKSGCVKLEEIAELIEVCERETALAPPKERTNPDCAGVGENNVPGCDCLKILRSLKH